MGDFLFARPSFWEGVARVVDIGGTLNSYNSSANGQEADRRALQSDWAAVCGDMQHAVEKVEREIIQPHKNKK